MGIVAGLTMALLPGPSALHLEVSMCCHDLARLCQKEHYFSCWPAFPGRLAHAGPCGLRGSWLSPALRHSVLAWLCWLQVRTAPAAF